MYRSGTLIPYWASLAIDEASWRLLARYSPCCSVKGSDPARLLSSEWGHYDGGSLGSGLSTTYVGFKFSPTPSSRGSLRHNTADKVTTAHKVSQHRRSTHQHTTTGYIHSTGVYLGCCANHSQTRPPYRDAQCQTPPQIGSARATCGRR